MKKKNLFAVVAMLSVLLFGIGTAHAITGVNDAVPGQDVVIPIICEGNQPVDSGLNPVGEPVYGSLDTIWAIAETSGPSCVLDDSVCVPKDLSGNPKTTVPGVVKTNVYVFDRFSVVRLDTAECWSKHDVISSDCQIMISAMTPIDRKAMEVTINNVTYFAGYVLYSQVDNCNKLTNTLTPWVYLNDISKGFATGFNGVSLENGTSTQLEETCSEGSCSGQAIGVTASEVYPRFFIMNDNTDTFNWWIFLAGRNEYAVEADQGLVAANSIHRWLTCFFCDENEKCSSNNIPIPYELNIIPVATYIPGGVFSSATFPKAGFAYCTIDEFGTFTGLLSQTVITGTLSFDGADIDAAAETYSLFAWAYQRALPVSTTDKLAVVHEIHRQYCSRNITPAQAPDGFLGDARELPFRFNSENGNDCTITGPHTTVVNP